LHKHWAEGLQEKKLKRKLYAGHQGMSIICLVIDFVQRTDCRGCKINVIAALQQLLKHLTLQHELSTAQSL